MSSTARPGSDRPLPLAGAGAPAAGTDAARFSYTCHRCNRCCRDRRIQVNPYEVMRLARNRGISTGELLDRWVDAETTSLRRRADGTCVFLEGDGCAVHADRPLACRLYPLGRIVRGDSETWVVLPPADGSAGVLARGGDVRSYVRRQGAAPYLRAADAYYEIVEAALVTASVVGEPAASAEARSVLDVEAAIETTGDPESDLAAHLGFLRSEFCGTR